MDNGIDSAWLFVSLIAGAVGMAMIVYGRRRKEGLPLLFGVVMAAFPYAVRSAWLVALIASALLAVFFLLRRRYS